MLSLFTLKGLQNREAKTLLSIEILWLYAWDCARVQQVLVEFKSKC